MRRGGPAFADNLREAARSLARARLRTVLGLVGIMIGIASVIAMVSTGEIATAESRRQFEALGHRYRDRQGARGRERSGIPLDTALLLAESVPSIAAAAPMVGVGGRIEYGSKRVSGSIRGATESLVDLGRLELADGRFVSDLDLRQFWRAVGAKVAEGMRRRGAWDIVARASTSAGTSSRLRASCSMPRRATACRSRSTPTRPFSFPSPPRSAWSPTARSRRSSPAPRPACSMRKR